MNLYDQEVKLLVLNFGADGGDHDEEALVNLIQWAGEARLAAQLLDLALAGDVALGWENDEPTFSTHPERVMQVRHAYAESFARLQEKADDDVASKLIIPGGS